MAAISDFYGEEDMLDCTEVDDREGNSKRASTLSTRLCLENCEKDPISLNTIPEDHVIRMKVGSEGMRCYDVETLYTFLKSKNSDPLTLKRFTQKQLNRIAEKYREVMNKSESEAPNLKIDEFVDMGAVETSSAMGMTMWGSPGADGADTPLPLGADTPLKIERLDLQYMEDFDRTNSHYRRFNNSILHTKGDYYIMSYRLFYAPKNLHEHEHEDPVVSYHPWNTKWDSKVDKPMLVLLKYDKETNRFMILEERDLGYFCPKDVPVKNVIADARLAMLNGKIYAHGNGWGVRRGQLGSQRKKLTTTVRSCMISRYCELVVEMLMRLETSQEKASDEKLPSDVHELIFPCMTNLFSYNRRGSDIIEKNWSFFSVHDNCYTEYGLQPHVVAKMDMLSPHHGECNHIVDCTDTYEQKNTIFEKVCELIGESCYFSPGGSLIVYNEKELINVGHFKYDYTVQNLLPIDPSKQRIHNLNYVYLMFFYTISSSPPFQLMRVSHAFIPTDGTTPYALVFAMGIAPIGNTSFVVSYGEGDDTSNLLILSKKELESMLVDVDSLQPQDYTFTWKYVK